MDNEAHLAILDVLVCLLALTFLFLLVHNLEGTGGGGAILGSFCGWVCGVSMLRVHTYLVAKINE